MRDYDMKIVFKNCVSDKEALMLTILIDDDGNEIKKFPMYVNEDVSKKLPALDETYTSLPDIIRMIYNSGRNGESIEFAEETVEI